MSTTERDGFSLVEVVIVVVVMAVLAAVLAPQFADNSDEAIQSNAEFNLHTLRTQIDLYRSQHGGRNPSASLVELTTTTDASGTIGRGSGFSLGPYIRDIPSNPFTGNDRITTISHSPVSQEDMSGLGGWLYNPSSGDVWIDYPGFVDH